MGRGPLDWIHLSGEGRESLFAITHYDEGSIGIYSLQGDRFSLASKITDRLGTADLAVGDFNGDATNDLFVLNTAQESLSVYLADGNGGFQAGATLNLREERIPDIYDIENGARFQALAVGNVNGDESMDAVVRSRDSVLLIASVTSQFRIDDRIAIAGVTHFLKGSDIDGDGDLDFVAAVRMTSGEETMQVYQNQQGRFSLIQILRTDLRLKGNNAIEAIFTDWNGDDIADLLVLAFSGAVQFYRGKGDGSFTYETEASPFPLGEMVGFDVADLDRDGKKDLVGLYRNQDGLTLMAGCGEDIIDVSSFRISAYAPNGEICAMKCVDNDGDGDPDVLVTRSFQDDLVWLENRSQKIDR